MTLDALGAPFLAVIALVGLGKRLVSPAYLHTSQRSFFRRGRARSWFYLCFYIFWAALFAIPLAGNIGLAWIIIEATTGVSALLVAYNGRRRSLESRMEVSDTHHRGMTVALLGIVALYTALPERSADWGVFPGRDSRPRAPRCRVRPPPPASCCSSAVWPPR